jgi:hypothetical protein
MAIAASRRCIMFTARWAQRPRFAGERKSLKDYSIDAMSCRERVHSLEFLIFAIRDPGGSVQAIAHYQRPARQSMRDGARSDQIP